jgi:hypothetical protein
VQWQGHEASEIERLLARKQCAPSELVEQLQHHGVAVAVVETSTRYRRLIEKKGFY